MNGVRTNWWGLQEIVTCQYACVLHENPTYTELQLQEDSYTEVTSVHSS